MGVHPGEYFNAGADGTRFYVTDGAAYQGQFPIDPPHEFEGSSTANRGMVRLQ
jgi:hypothetical protein